MPQVFGLILALMFLTGCYSIKQAWLFNDLYNSRQLITDAIEDPSRPKDERNKLELVGELVGFAASQGLNTDGAYRYVIDLPHRAVSYTVQAAYWDRLELVEWWFPVVGNVPYLGYFNRQERDAKAVELEAQGYEVAYGNVGAFSSLGWFDDPIYTSMLARNDADLAHLLFHELTHRTFWSQGSVKFNENLAEFCAVQLTLTYLASNGKPSSIDDYLARRRDRIAFKHWLKELRASMAELLEKRSNEAEADIRLAKRALVQEFKLDRLPEFETRYYSFVAKKDWNNAEILSSGLYAPETQLFEDAYRCTGELTVGGFLSRLKLAEESHDDVFDALRSLCHESPASGGSQK